MIFVTGDMHGDYSRLNRRDFPQQEFMTKKDFVIVCGDFGIWRDNAKGREWLQWLNNKPFTTLFVDGNHENYDLLAEYPVKFWNGGVVQFINDSVIHLMRGEIYILQGKTFFAMGGASSHDIEDGILELDDPHLHEKKRQMNALHKRYRVNHESWWAAELPNNLEYENAIRSLARYNWEVDYVITHCAPATVAKHIANSSYPRDNLTIFFDEVAKKLDYKFWMFGHYHKNLSINKQFILLYDEIVELTVENMVDDIDVTKIPDLDLSHVRGHSPKPVENNYEEYQVIEATQDIQEIQKTQDYHNTQNIQEIQEPQDYHNTQNIQEIQETQDFYTTQNIQEIQETQEYYQTQNIQEIQEPQDYYTTQNIQEIQETQEVVETQEYYEIHEPKVNNKLTMNHKPKVTKEVNKTHDLNINHKPKVKPTIIEEFGEEDLEY